MSKKQKKSHRATAREPISKKERFDIFNRDGFMCVYCGQSKPDVVLHVDHIKPVAKGGTNDRSNLVTACSACNGGKGATELLPQNNKKWLELNHPPRIIDSFSKEHIKQADMFVGLLLQELYRKRGGADVCEFISHFLELVCGYGMDDTFTKLANQILSDICVQASNHYPEEE